MGRPARWLRAMHAAFAPVVGREREVPIAELGVQLGQIVERGSRRCEHIAPVVAEHVLLQREVAAGCRHELPHARRFGRRHRLRVECALDERQQRELRGHAAALELFDDVEQIAGTALGHALNVVGPRRVPLLAVAHPVVVEIGHRKAAPNAHPQIGARGFIVEVDLYLGSQRVDWNRDRSLFGRCRGRGLGRCRLWRRDFLDCDRALDRCDDSRRIARGRLRRWCRATGNERQRQ